MKKIWTILSSTNTSLVLLILFALSMAIATFLENSYDTITAGLLIYKAKWFEVILLLMALNFLANINKYNLLQPGRLTGFLFHFSFILMIIGAGVTRYFGSEGNMSIREGQESGIYYSSDPYLVISSEEKDLEKKYFDRPFYFSRLEKPDLSLNFETEKKSSIKIKLLDYFPDAAEMVDINVPGGVNIIELSLSLNGVSDKILLEEKKLSEFGGFIFSFNGDPEDSAIIISGVHGNLRISFPFEIVKENMTSSEVITAGISSELSSENSYTSPKLSFFMSGFFKSARKKLVSEINGEQRPDALVLGFESENKKEEFTLWGGADYFISPQKIKFEGMTFLAGYGQKAIDLPFTLKLEDFILERYPGSNSPSSFESIVTLSDKRNNLNEKHRIFMNNVLDYDGYRFFQSSYNQDEKGTVLSVNRDFWGTWITYFSYILLGCGLVLTLLNKNSRFVSLISLIKSARLQRMGLLVLLLFFLTNSGFAQIKNTGRKYVDKEHALKFGHLVVQGTDGRFQPVHTLAYDVMHKISRKDNVNFPGEESLDAMQVFLSILVNPEFWKKQEIIYIREKSVREVLNLYKSYAAFDDFFDEEGNYKIQEFAETAFRKKQSEQNIFDKDIIKVDERMNIMMMVMRGDFLKIFPAPGIAGNRWLSWNDEGSLTPLEGNINILNKEMNLPVFNYNNIFRLYFTELIYASNSGNYVRVDSILNQLVQIQREFSPEQVIPSGKMVDLEIHYNRINIFSNLRNAYGVLGLLLLFSAFIFYLLKGIGKGFRAFLYFLIILAALAFAFHTYGMGIRWYLTGHAPWSNGYETLIFIGWSAMLAGFCFLRFSFIPVAATSILAFFTLMTAGHSSYDPQLTNLVPVLKSYWLIFHVAALVISYGFFGLGFILSLIILFLYLFTNKSNLERNTLLIKEWTFINEMNITVGLVFATIGTFLGGVWANESWGRYWGWDAKETWALIIIIVYSFILHLRLVPKLRGEYIFNVAAVLGFGTVLMTFFGVNYYFTKGLHSYASGDSPVFPVWAWLAISIIFMVILFAGISYLKLRKYLEKGNQH